jgi:hypothetical protein
LTTSGQGQTGYYRTWPRYFHLLPQTRSRSAECVYWSCLTKHRFRRTTPGLSRTYTTKAYHGTILFLFLALTYEIASKLAIRLRKSGEKKQSRASSHLAGRVIVVSRNHARAHRGASRPAVTPGSGGDGDSDSSGDSDPPAPGVRAHHPLSVISHFFKKKPRYLNRRLPHRCWRVDEGGRAA